MVTKLMVISGSSSSLSEIVGVWISVSKRNGGLLTERHYNSVVLGIILKIFRNLSSTFYDEYLLYYTTVAKHPGVLTS